jgi:arylsulfatase A-like enzyme
MIAKFPGQRTPGRTEHTAVHAIDVMPTFFDLAGARAPSGHLQDGVNLRPLIEARARLAPRDLFWYQPFYDQIWLATPSATIRGGRFKLIEYFGDWVDDQTREYHPEPKLELFDLEADIGEKNDLSAREPKRVRALRQRLHRWLAACGAQIPKQNPRYDPTRALDTVRGKPVM